MRAFFVVVYNCVIWNCTIRQTLQLFREFKQGFSIKQATPQFVSFIFATKQVHSLYLWIILDCIVWTVATQILQHVRDFLV